MERYLLTFVDGVSSESAISEADTSELVRVLLLSPQNISSNMKSVGNSWDVTEIVSSSDSSGGGLSLNDNVDRSNVGRSSLTDSLGVSSLIENVSDSFVIPSCSEASCSRSEMIVPERVLSDAKDMPSTDKEAGSGEDEDIELFR